VIDRLRRVPLMALVPVLAVLTLFSWAWASPIGSAPDDDFHLVSSWCVGPTAAENCAPGDEPATGVVPVALVEIACYAYDAETSAACQGEQFPWDTSVQQQTKRANFTSAYPPIFYAVTGALTGADVQLSALAMRVLTVLLFVGLTVALWLLLPVHRRSTLAWGWLITTLPLGLFVIASNNPSAWAVIGLGSCWIALLGWYETEGRRRWGLGAVFVLSVLIASGARGDAALYSGLAMLAVMILTLERSKRWMLSSILPVVMGLVALFFFAISRQVAAGTDGFTGGSTEAEEQLGGFGLLAYNVLNVPYLWSGVLGDWALGWLDTSLPRIVPLAVVAVFVAVGFAGIRLMWGRKAIVLALFIVVLWVLPVYVLQQGGDSVGSNLQPRYLLPLIVVFGGLLVMQRATTTMTFTRPQRFAIITALGGAHFVALHINMRRYITGIDGSSVNLDAGAEWWWAGPVGPNAVWLLGSLAYALLVGILVTRLSGPRAAAFAAQVPGTPITR